MKSFQYPQTDSWLPRPVFETYVRRYEDAWTRMDSPAEGESGAWAFTRAQNELMLTKFFLEQAFGEGAPGALASKLLERDAGSYAKFVQQLRSVAASPRAQWIVWSLSFATFRFHIFPVGDSMVECPFCVSPMLCICMSDELVKLLDRPRGQILEDQLQAIDWDVVENRLACLTKPLDLFEEQADCQDDCQPSDT